VPKVSKEMMASLITECLIRSLGLPEMIEDQSSDAFLRHWNVAEDSVSKLLSQDGEAALSRTASPQPVIWGNEGLPEELTKAVSTKTITDFDAKMLALLYCKELKPGMDRLTVVVTLLNSQECGLKN
jgi:hypothetical protein